jgi:hypothetical protein
MRSDPRKGSPAYIWRGLSALGGLAGRLISWTLKTQPKLFSSGQRSSNLPPLPSKNNPYTHSPIRTLLYVTEHHHRYNPRAETSIPAALISATSNNQIETHLVPKIGGRYICSISVALQRAKSGTEPPRLSALLVLRFRRVGWVVFGKAGHRYIRPRRGCCLCDLGSLAEAGSSGCFPLKCREVFCLWRLCGRRLDTNT